MPNEAVEPGMTATEAGCVIMAGSTVTNIADEFAEHPVVVVMITE